MPKISVIMPVYNTQEPLLREAIESILNQTYTDFELIIIDDGSKNNVSEVVKSYTDERIKFYQNEKNIGINNTNNKALSLVNGEYIARMDSDDISLPDRFLKQVEFLDNNPDVGVLGTSFQMFGKYDEETIMPTTNDEIVQRIFDGDTPIANPTSMMRAHLIKEIGHNLEYAYAEDFWLWAMLVGKTKFANLPEILLKYRWYGGNVSKLHTIEQSLNTQKIMFEIAQKHKGINCEEEIAVVNKLKQGLKISSDEFKTFISKKGMIKYKKVAYKTAKKLCTNLFYKIFG